MTPKQYLQQLPRINERINAKHERLDRLKSLAEKVTTGYGLAYTQGGKHLDRIAEIVCKIIDLTDDLNNDIDKLVNLKSEAQKRIDRIKSTSYRELLELRYLDNKTWIQIANAMHYTERGIYKMHGRALEAFKKCT